MRIKTISNIQKFKKNTFFKVNSLMFYPSLNKNPAEAKSIREKIYVDNKVEKEYLR